MRNMMACTVTGQTQIQIQIQRQIQTWNWIHYTMRKTSWLALSQVKGQALLLPSLSRYILKIMKLRHLELSSIQALSQIVIWSAGGGEHPGGGRQEGAGGAGQARGKDPLGSSFSRQEMLFEELENIIERSLWEQLIKIGKGSIRTWMSLALLEIDNVIND